MNNPTPRLMIILLTLLLAMVLLSGYLRNAEAREVFNPHALEIDNPGQPVADLSTFAESGGQLPGTYRVTVFVNGEKQGDAQDIAFTDGAEKETQPADNACDAESLGRQNRRLPGAGSTAAGSTTGRHWPLYPDGHHRPALQ